MAETYRIKEVSKKGKTIFQVVDNEDDLWDEFETREDAEKELEELRELEPGIMDKVKDAFSFTFPFLLCAAVVYWAILKGDLEVLLSVWFTWIGIPVIIIGSFTLLEKFHEWIRHNYWDGTPIWAYPIYGILGLICIASTIVFFIVGAGWFFGL